MIETQAPDDIFALFSRFDLDMSQYRVFHHQAVQKSALGHSEPTTVSPAAAEEKVLHAANQQDPRPDRFALYALERHLSVARERSKYVSPNGSEPKVMQVAGVSGGVGVTTVLATLARLLTRDGGTCSVYDGDPHSMLPFHFGLPWMGHGKRFAGMQALLRPPLRLLGHEELPCGEADSAREVLNALREPCDTLLLQSSAHVGLAGAARLIVAIPDLNCLAAVRRLKPATLKDSICVLNRFNPEADLDRELMSWFENHFAQVIALRQSHLAAEALAEGCTVLDYAPDSLLASDYERLGELVAPKNQEVLSLCS